MAGNLESLDKITIILTETSCKRSNRKINSKSAESETGDFYICNNNDSKLSNYQSFFQIKSFEIDSTKLKSFQILFNNLVMPEANQYRSRMTTFNESCNTLLASPGTSVSFSFASTNDSNATPRWGIFFENKDGTFENALMDILYPTIVHLVFEKNDKKFVVYPEIDESIFQKKERITLYKDYKTTQKIFFGAPGTGKSYLVNKIINSSIQKKVPFGSPSVFERELTTFIRKKYNDPTGDKTKRIKNFLTTESSCNIFRQVIKKDIKKISECYSLDDAKKIHTALKKDGELYWSNINDNPSQAVGCYVSFLESIPGSEIVSPLNTFNFRTTFHPDYDYAQFVGTFKPTSDEPNSNEPNSNNAGISYKFIPQTFTNAYVKAWECFLKSSGVVYLVIEEINRGNCAQIFGDIFQLLDRDDFGYSEYAIDANADLAQYLEAQFKKLKLWEQYNNEIANRTLSNCEKCKIFLPPTLNILATMNTSDQSLFPMDSAFKRRFEWKYIPINDKEESNANFNIDIGSGYSWLNFIRSVNKLILDITHSEDKQLGEFFVKPDKLENTISKDLFLGKVMFYLWNDICKDEHEELSFFRTQKDSAKKEVFFTFQDLYKDGGEDKLIEFMNWVQNT